MKKIYLFFIILLSMFILVSCSNNKDYDDEGYLSYRLRMFDAFLTEEQKYLIITNNEELDDYMNDLDISTTDNSFVEYLEHLKNINYFKYNRSLLLINNFSPISTKKVIFKNIKLDENNLIVDLDSYLVSGIGIKTWSFVVEVNERLINIEDVIIKINNVEKQEDLYLNSYTYNYSTNVADLGEEIIVIESVNELEQYINFLDTQLEYYRLNYYYNHLLKYDEDYFVNEKLILINYNANSGSINYKYKDFQLKNGNLVINFEVFVPEIGTCDIFPWNFIFEVNNLLKFNDVSTSYKYIEIN